MTEAAVGRRDLFTLAAAGAVLAAGSTAAGPTPAAIYAPQPQPLPFDPKTQPGLSERLLTSHHDNNYVGAVKRIGAIGAQLAAIDPVAAPTFLVNGLKREELLAINSMLLHEVYFGGFGTPTAPSGGLSAAIEQSFGSQARWAAEFSGMGKALGGGSGWVLLTWSGRDRRLVNTWAADHTMTLAGGTPLLALDMYEHAYHMDYGSKAGGYVDAYMKLIDWRRASAAFAKLA